MFALMLFMFFFFLGFLAMFLYLLKRLDEQARALKDEHAQLRVLLRAMESRLDKMVQTEKLNALFQGQIESDIATPALDNAGLPGDSAVRDPLLHLNFDTLPGLGDNVGQKLDLHPEPKNWDLELTPPDKARE